jgi:hypothetical protein
MRMARDKEFRIEHYYARTLERSVEWGKTSAMSSRGPLTAVSVMCSEAAK